MKKIFCLLFLCTAILSLFPSCGNSDDTSAPAVKETDAISQDTEPPTEKNDWIIPQGVEQNGTSFTNLTKDEPNLVTSVTRLSQNFSLSMDVTLKGKGYTKVYFESEFDDKGEIKNGICVAIDGRTGVFIVHLYNNGDAKKQSSTKYNAPDATEFTVRINRDGSSLDCELYDKNDTKSPLAYTSLRIKALKGKQHAIAMLGDVMITSYAISDATTQTEQTYTNPVFVSSNDLGDPTAYYEDGKYYVLTTGRFNCYVTEDLVNYKDIGVIADKNLLYGHTYFGGGSIFKHDGIYYLFYTSYLPNTNKGIMCVATSDKVTGPYTQPKQTTVDAEACPESSAGAFPIVAEDGKTYLYWYETLAETGNTIFGAEIEFKDGIVKVKKETKTRLLIPDKPWESKSENGASGRVVERPNVYYHDGYYYLFYAGSHWKTSYGQGYAVSKTPLGEYIKYENNPILESTASLHGVGCSYIVASPDKSELFLVYHAHTSITSLSRNICIDRIYFEDNGDNADIAKVVGPTVTPQKYPN